MCLAQIVFQFYLYPYVFISPHSLALSPGTSFQQHWVSRYLATFSLRYLTTVGFRPPRGRFSHLAMFRVGTLLFIPGYLTVTLYRVFASPESGGSLTLMMR